VIVQPPPTSAIAFVDGRHGWVGGQGGLLGTSDGKSFGVAFDPKYLSRNQTATGFSAGQLEQPL